MSKMKIVFTPNDPTGQVSPLTIDAQNPPYQLIRGSLNGFGGVTYTHYTSQAPNQSGAVYYFSRMNERELSFRFRVYASSFDDAQTKKQAISQVFSAYYGEGTLRIYTDAGNTKYFDIRCVSNGVTTMYQTIAAHNDTMFEVSVNLTACHPMFFDPVKKSVNFDDVIGGFALPFKYDFSLGIQYAGTVRNSGTTSTPCTITVNGPCTNIKLRNRRTGELIQVNASADTGEKITINTDPETSFVRKTDKFGEVTNIFYALSADSVLWQLEPGDNIIEYNDSTSITANEVLVEWYNQYEGVW